jgi:hypothetical protein
MGVLLLECVERTRVGDGFARCGDVKHGRLEDPFWSIRVEGGWVMSVGGGRWTSMCEVEKTIEGG